MPFTPVPQEVRSAVLRDYEVLDTPPEEDFDDLVELTAELCGTKIALMSLVDGDRLFLKAETGMGCRQVATADLSFCSHVVAHGQPLVVHDASGDARFSGMTAVAGDPGIRFFAGVPLLNSGGVALGTLCVMSTEPRRLSDRQLSALCTLAKQVVAQLEVRRSIGVAQRAQEALERSMEVQDLFVAAAAHDLRGPLSCIAGFAQLLERSAEELSPDQRRMCMWSIAQAGRRLGGMVANLSAYQRIKAGEVHPDRRPVDVGSVAERVAGGLDPEELESVRLHVEGPVVVPADEAMVERIIESLVNNALKHGEGTVQLTVAGDARGAIVTVEDEGPGLSDQEKSAAFDCYQGHAWSPTGGRAIGLFVAARFAALHGGRAWVEDRPGGGATFQVYLPSDGHPGLAPDST